MTTTAERFALDPALLGHLMARQAPDLAKAVLELVMNSIDGGASEVDVAFAGGKVTVRDNGGGLPQDPDEIRRVFGTFGAPRTDDEESPLGEFRLGRGQSMSLGPVEYRTGPTRIRVDMRNRVDAWEMEQGLPFQPGCVVTLTLAEPPPESSVEDLARLVLHLPGQVSIDGRTVNVPAASKAWDIEDDDAYLDLGGDSLRVYNRGAYVREYVGEHWGVAGTVVSKGKLKLTVGRNEVMTDCPVFRRIVATLEQAFVDQLRARRPGSLPAHLRRRALRLACAGKLRIRELEPFHVLHDARGRWVGLRHLFQTPSYSVGPAGDPVAYHAIAEMGVVVLSRRTIEDDGYDLAALLRRAAKAFGMPVPRAVPWDQVVAAAKLGRRTVDDASLPAASRAVLFGLQFASRAVCDLIEEAGLMDAMPRVRRVVAASHDSEADFTDGETFVALRRDLLEQIAKGTASVGTAVALIARAYIRHPTPTDGAPPADEAEAAAEDMRTATMLGILWTTRPSGWIRVERHSIDEATPLNTSHVVNDLGDVPRWAAAEMARKARQLRAPLAWASLQAGEAGKRPEAEINYNDPVDPAHRRAQSTHVQEIVNAFCEKHGMPAATVTEEGGRLVLTRRQDPGSVRRGKGDWWKDARLGLAQRVATTLPDRFLCDTQVRVRRLPANHPTLRQTAVRVAKNRLRGGTSVARDLLWAMVGSFALEGGIQAVYVTLGGDVPEGDKARHAMRNGYDHGRNLQSVSAIKLRAAGRVEVTVSCDPVGGRGKDCHVTASMPTSLVKAIGWSTTMAMLRRGIHARRGMRHAAEMATRARLRAKAAERDAPPSPPRTRDCWSVDKPRPNEGWAQFVKDVGKTMRNGHYEPTIPREHAATTMEAAEGVIRARYQAGRGALDTARAIAVSHGWRFNSPEVTRHIEKAAEQRAIRRLAGDYGYDREVD